nr:hypothetical protein [bacterium]
STDIDNNVEFRRRNSKGVVVYRDRATRELRLAISTSSTGEAYEKPQTLAFSQNVDVFDVAILNSHVVVVYYDKLDKRIEAVSGL